MSRPAFVCPDCGTVHTEYAEALGAREEMIERLREDIANLELERRSQRAQIARLKDAQNLSEHTRARRTQALKVLEHWRFSCAPGTRELGGKRLEHCMARLKAGYTVPELMRCCDGYALKPYVIDGRRTHEGPKDRRFVDAELIFRDAKRVDAGLAIADQADDLRNMLSPKAISGDLRPSDPLTPSTPASLSRFAAAAAAVAAKGLAVFPCQAKSKNPATRHGLKDAKRDQEAIRRCWTAHPELNVAIPTGAVNGLIVLDVDGGQDDQGWTNLHALEDRYGDLPDTLSVKTPSGGQHFYFQHPGVEIRNTTGFPAAGLDIRGDGGYVLIPPSVNATGMAYVKDEELPPAPMPAWLAQRLRDYQQRQAAALANGEFAKLLTEGASTGNRNDRLLRIAGSLIARQYTADMALGIVSSLNLTHCKPPLPTREVAAIVASVATMETRKLRAV